MEIKNRIKSLTFIFVISAVLVITGCGKKGEKKEAETQKKENKEIISVKTDKVRFEKLNIKKIYTGTIEGEEQANVVSYLAERVIEVPVKVGDFVKKDQILIRLDKGGVTSQYYQAQTNLQNLERTLNRMKALYEAGAVSKQSLDEVQTGYDIAKENFRAAKNAVEISSPIDGVVLEVKINPGDFTSPGIPIVKVAKINRLKLLMSIGESDIPFIKNGQEVNIYSEINTSITAKGKVYEISKSADLNTRTFMVKALFANVKDQLFRPGMFAKAEVLLNSAKENMIIPRESVINTEKGPQVYVIKDGKAIMKYIKTGMQNEKDIEVVEGLEKDEIVATLGAQNLSDGVDVFIANNPETSK